MKLILVAGARPNFVKIAPLLRAINKYNLQATGHMIETLLVHTGQHYDYEMSQVFFKELELPEPDIYLGIGSGTHAEQTGKIMIEFEKILKREKPDMVVVVGDVNSTLAAALAAVKLHIPIAHIEAGLRSFDMKMPEEINRKLTDAVSDFLFTHSPEADEYLVREGIDPGKIHFVGNVMVDSLLYSKDRAKARDTVTSLGLTGGSYALLTLHRPENVDNRQNLLKIIATLEKIASELPVVFPIHPRTKKRLEEFNLNLPVPVKAVCPDLACNHNMALKSQEHSIITSEAWQSQSSILLIPPLGYLDFLNMEMNSRFVMTDSGGIQEETTVLGVPCLILRNSTERPVTVSKGTNVVVGNDTGNIVKEALKILSGAGKAGSIPDLWDGKASERIISILAEWGR